MPRQPRVTGKATIAALRRAGFEVVPVHGSETVGPGLLAKILRDCDLTRDAFRELA